MRKTLLAYATNAGWMMMMNPALAEGDFIYTGLFGRTKKSCDKNLIAQRIIKFCAKLNSKRQVSYKSLQHSGLDCFGSVVPLL